MAVMTKQFTNRCAKREVEEVEDKMLKMCPSVVATHYKCCSSCLTLLHTQCTLYVDDDKCGL